jgi:hypothetical protein
MILAEARGVLTPEKRAPKPDARSPSNLTGQ